MGCAAAVMRAQIRETDIRLFFAYTVNPGFRPVNRRHIEKHEAPGVRDTILSQAGIAVSGGVLVIVPSNKSGA
jgi:hypothetical protein